MKTNVCHFAAIIWVFLQSVKIFLLVEKAIILMTKHNLEFMASENPNFIVRILSDQKLMSNILFIF